MSEPPADEPSADEPSADEGADRRADESPAARARRLFREVGLIYGGVLTAIIAFAVLASFVGFVAEILYAIVAFLFFFVPQRWMERKELAPEPFGMTAKRWPAGIAWGVGATVVTLPFFAVGYWVWETQIHDRELDIDPGHYRQYPVEIEGEPKAGGLGWGADEAGVWVWSQDDRLHVGLRNAGAPNNQVRLRAAAPFALERLGVLHVRPVYGPGEGPGEGPVAGQPGDGDAGNGPREASEWIVALNHSQSRGEVIVDGPERVEVELTPLVDGQERWPLYVGPKEELQEDGRWSGARDYGWILLWIATQFLLIALPEEYFYRGYVQTRLAQALRARRRARGQPASDEAGDEDVSVFGFTPAIVLTSLLFGLGHLLVPVGGVLLANRFSVFFPSLLFGWLRRRTGSIVAPTVYHACSNLMVLFAAVHIG